MSTLKTAPSIGDEETVMVFWTTLDEMERTFARLWQKRHEIAESIDCDHDSEYVLHAAIGMLRSAREWSGDGDLACVARHRCRDIAALHLAVEDVFAGDYELLGSFGNISDAASSGYWSAHTEDTEDYVFEAGGWRMTRERGREVEDDS